ncbi:MAG: hypothetical protein ABI137_10315 [Antricoccus sp.]
MSHGAQAIVLSVLILATSVWIGGYVAIAVVARTSAATLDPSARVAFFKSLGRAYLLVGLPALLIALGSGAFLLRNRPWDALLISTVIVAIGLVALLAIAVAQARAMTRLRRLALGDHGDQHLALRIKRRGRAAGLLRAALGIVSVTLVVLGAFLATTAGA